MGLQKKDTQIEIHPSVIEVAAFTHQVTSYSLFDKHPLLALLIDVIHLVAISDYLIIESIAKTRRNIFPF